MKNIQNNGSITKFTPYTQTLTRASYMQNAIFANLCPAVAKNYFIFYDCFFLTEQ